MNEIATSTDKLPAAPAGPKRITHKVRRAIDIMVAGDAKTITEAAEKAGLSREHLSRELSKSDVNTFLQQKVARALAIASARAGAVKTELLDSTSEHVRNDASSFVLGLAGIRPAESLSIAVNVNVARAGYCIDLRPEPGEIIDEARANPQVIEHE